jgi:SAM-dependent methyltransferase
VREIALRRAGAIGTLAAIVCVLAADGSVRAVPAAPESPSQSTPSTPSAPPAQPKPKNRLFSAAVLGLIEPPDRIQWQPPELIMDDLSIADGAVVADLGAGGGWFTIQLARRVGPNGVVYAEDVQSQMIDAIRRRAQRENLRNVRTIIGTADDPRLPHGIDAALIVDTYHHIDDRLAYFARLRTALAPGGRVAIIDYHKKPLPLGPPLEHKLAREVVLDEMARAGWSLAGEPTFLPYQYFLIFAPAPH